MSVDQSAHVSDKARRDARRSPCTDPEIDYAVRRGLDVNLCKKGGIIVEIPTTVTISPGKKTIHATEVLIVL